MEENTIITLDDNSKWELLCKVEYEAQNYFLAQSNETYEILKETKENNEIYVEKETDENTLLEVFKLLTKEFAHLITNLTFEDLK